ncbi:MAG: Spo0B domain-containing protein [Streptosporangiaceae bacterium]|nr:Spo0B domain-containing protein [Streptosporangiaceae bacterium]
MLHMVRLQSRGWSLARQLVVLQLCVVVTAVTIEAMVAIYRGPSTASLEERQILGLVTLTEVALLVGIAGSLFVADRVRRQTFDMEPAEIAKRYQHHDSVLHAIREGLIITDVDGDIVLANDEARRLLELAADCEGKRLRDQAPDAEWAAAQTAVADQLQYAAGRVLMVSRSQAEVDGRPAGAVTTLRDRTELQQALKQLSEARELGDELRKQAHEHANHLQMIIALMEMQEYDEATRVCAKYAEMPQMLSAQVLDQTTDPMLASRLQISHARAERRGVQLRLDGTPLGAEAWRDLRDDLADIVGNLVDNAIDAASDRDPGGWVRLSLACGTDGWLHISVRDNGGGITAEPVEQVFTPHWSTKGSGRGFGLALVRDKVARLDGTITAHNDGGAVFDVRIPQPRGTTEE